MFNAEGKPTVKFRVGCPAATDGWTMVLEPLGTHFEHLLPTEILTVEFVVNGLGQLAAIVPEITQLAHNVVEIALEVDWNDIRVSNSSDIELEL